MNKEVIMRGIGRCVIAIVQASIVGAMIALPLAASQAPLFNPTSGTLSGLSMVQNQNNANDALATCNAGGSAPSTQFLSGAASNSDCWDDTSTTGWIKHRIWMNGTFVATAFYDLTNSLYTGIVGGGAINSVASAATTDLCGGTQYAAYMNVTGTVTITSFGSSCVTGQWKRVTFTGILTLTYNATSLILPTAANITTAAGDTADVVALGSGNWIVSHYQRATGAPLSTVGLSVGANALATSALGDLEMPVNMSIAVATASSNLAVTVNGANGSALSSTNPLLVGFRSQTATNGAPIIANATSIPTFTLLAANSMGCTTAVACRLWGELICQTESAGACTSVLVGLSAQSSPTSVLPLAENGLVTTGAGTGGGSTLGTMQTSVASVTGVAFRIAFYLDATWLSGTGWSLSAIRLFSPGMKKPGDVVQRAFENTGVSLSITPSSTINLIQFTASIGCGLSTGATTSILFQRGSTTLATRGLSNSTGGSFQGMAGVTVLDAPATTSPTTYQMTSAGTACSLSGAELIELEEIMGALAPEEMPANDDGRRPLAMVG